MAENQVVSLDYLDLARGCSVTAPPRTLGPNSPNIWRSSLNMLPRDGVIKGRPGIRRDLDAGFFLNFAIGSRDTDSEMPHQVYCSASATGDFIALVTDRQLWVFYAGAWRNVTPTYIVNTVTATNGSPTVTGAGPTAWQTRNITANQWMEIPLASGDWYKILSVDSETQITLTTNFTGATGAGKSYQIRRTFIGGGLMDSNRLMFSLIYNENLYVAGTRLGGADGVIRPAVIKVSDIFSTAPTVTYLTSSVPLTATLDVITGLSRIAGITALQDGRIVIAANFNEALWSSNLNDAVWTTSPAGGNPISDVNDHVEALGRFGDDLTFHFSSGIVWGRQTGQATEPLAFKRSGATMGTVCSQTLREYLGGQAFVANDGDVKFFDGNRVTSLGNGELRRRIQLETSFSRSEYNEFHAGVISARDEYVLFKLNTPGDTFIWTYQPQIDSWWSGRAVGDIGALSEGAPEFSGVTPDNVALLGIVAAAGTGNVLLAYYREGVVDDTTVATYFVETDDLDLGLPMVDKSPHSVVVLPVAAMTSLVASVRREYETSYTATNTLNLAANTPKVFWFLPGELAGIKSWSAHRWKLSGQALVGGLRAITVRALPATFWEHQG